ncbi:ricin B lectin domain-containing protein, partial [Aspergillus parasiticus]
MSDFNGPGVYTIVPRHVDSKRLDVDDSDEDNIRLQLYDPITSGKQRYDQQFMFAHLGNKEFFIISLKHGTYLTASDDEEQLTSEVLPPVNRRIRWKLHPVGDGSGAFFISSLAYPGKVIDVQYGYDDNETAIIIYPPKEDDNENQQFFLISP